MDRNYPAKNIPFEVVDTQGEEIVLSEDVFTPYEEIVEEEPLIEVVDITPWEPHPLLILTGKALVEAGKGIGIASVFVGTVLFTIVVFVLKHTGGILWAVTVALCRYVSDQVSSVPEWEDRDWDRPRPPASPTVNVETNVDVGPGGQVNVTTNVRTR